MSEPLTSAVPGFAVSTLGVVVHPRKDIGGSIQTIIEWAREHGVRVVATYDDQERVGGEVELVDATELCGTVDGIIALGGDGTMLGAMRRMARSTVPILGVNHGNLGFLVEVDPMDLLPALDRFSHHDFKLQPHDAVQLSTEGGDPILAFNDVVFARSTMVGAASVDLTVEGIPFGYFKADAVIVATSTGSTAYNYAAGGPILSPTTHALVVTPVAPMSGISRTLVLGPSDELTFEVAPDSAPITVLADGVEVAQLAPRQTITVESLPQAAQVVRLDVAAHARRSQLKLSLLDLPLRTDDAASLLLERTRDPNRAAAGLCGEAPR